MKIWISLLIPCCAFAGYDVVCPSPVAQNNSRPANSLAMIDHESKWDLFADVLLLRADQITTWALKNTFIPYTASGGVPAVNYTENTRMALFDWDFGVRAGLGYCFKRDRWDLQLYYTWFRTKGSDRTEAGNSANVTSSLLGEWLTYGFKSKRGQIQWNILLNAIDWEFGRNCYPGKDFSFRPHLGIKGGWIRQTIHSQWIPAIHAGANENLKNDFWGLGPKCGVNTKWGITAFNNHSFHLFADGSLALLGGCWTIKDIQKTTMNSEIRSINPTTWSGTLMGEALAGLGWDYRIKNDSNFGARVGYELQYWFDQLKIFTFLEGTLHAALVLQGGMLDVHFNY